MYHYVHNNNLLCCKNCSCKCFYFLFIEAHVSLTCIGSKWFWSENAEAAQEHASKLGQTLFFCVIFDAIAGFYSLHKKLGSVKVPVDTLHLHGEKTAQGIYLISVAR